MEKIKAVIFDLDGTIGDTIPLCVEAFKKSIEPLINRSITDEDIIATFGPSEEGTIMALAPEFYEKGVSSYLYFYEQLHEMCPKPFDGIVNLLTLLKDRKIRIAMVTGKGKHSTAISLCKFGILHFFERIETGHQSGPRKAEDIESVYDFFDDIKKNEIVYVGDAPSDIKACKRVGIPIVAAAWAEASKPEKLKELMPDQLFYSITDFTNWICSKI
jgi:phosphoglycolate phosphatase-like HAD superfamily hydrolase